MFPQTEKKWRGYRALNQNWSYQPTLAGRAIQNFFLPKQIHSRGEFTILWVKEIQFFHGSLELHLRLKIYLPCIQKEAGCDVEEHGQPEKEEYLFRYSDVAHGEAARSSPPVKHNFLTLKALNKNWGRRHFNFLLLSFEENKAWCFKWILCLAEDSHETSSLIFSEKQWKNIYECRLLQSWLAL